MEAKDARSRMFLSAEGRILGFGHFEWQVGILG
jgi:hypothetical protein